MNFMRILFYEFMRTCFKMLMRQKYDFLLPVLYYNLYQKQY